MQSVSDSPPRAPPVKYNAPLGTRWAKEKAAAGGATAFDLPTDPKAIGPWILGECIGKGASGRVKIAKHRRTGQLAAVKILPVAPLVNSRASLATQQAKSDKQRLGIDREITMMKLMNHPNIMHIYDVYEGDKELFLVLEYVEGGELFDFLVNKGRLPSNEALIYFRQIIYGLNYAHTFSIIHRDLKPENILIASLSPPQIKIADWGMAAFAPPTLQLETSCGSPHYASPEIVNGEKYQGNATDIWSCGVILYALLTGRLPFDDKNVRTLLTKVKSGKYDMPTWIDPLAKDLLSKMLIVDVKQRITIPEILSHPWLISQSAIPFSASDGSKFTILAPPLPPSPSILARPISSLDLIDSELFSSLRIIWGRHADSQGESIKRDLCSPAGQGVHAKAFYFLLGKYREGSSKNRSNDAEFDLQRSSSIDLDTAKFNLGWELDHSGAPSGLRKYDVSKTHHIFFSPQTSSSPSSALPAAAQRAPHPNISIASPPGTSSRKRTFTDGSLPTKDQSGSGSRATANSTRAQVENWKAQLQAQKEISNPAASSSASSTSTANSHMLRKPSVSSQVTIAVGAAAPGANALGRSGGRPVVSRRGYTASSMMPDRREPSYAVPSTGTTPGSMGFSQHLQQIQARAASVSSSSRSSQSRSRSQRPKSSVGPLSPFTETEKRAMFAFPILDVLDNVRDSANAAGSSVRGPRPDAGGELGAPVDPSPVDLPLLTAPQTDNPELQRTMEDITQKVNELVQALASSQQAATVSAPSPLPPTAETGDAVRSTGMHSHELGHAGYSHPHPHAKVDEGKENQSIDEESWSHVNVSGDVDRSGGIGLGMGLAGHHHVRRDVGREIGNVSQNVSASPSKGKKEKEKKSRPPPLDLPNLNPKRTTFAMLGSPIALSTPIHPPPSSANRIMASPVVGEFKGWFSNLFSWKNSSANGGILYSADDIHRTRLNVARILEGLGIIITNHPSESYPNSEQTQVEVLFCRVDQPTADGVNGISLKNVRFRVEFRAGPGLSTDTQPSTHPVTGGAEDNPYFLSAPPQTPNYGMSSTSGGSTGLTASGMTGSSRPRGSMLLGRSVSHGTPLASPVPALAKWDFPPGCLCALVAVHEKGSMSTFRAVWRRLKEEYNDASTAYPCFSPAIPETPYAESQ